MRRYAIRKVATPVPVEGGVADGALPRQVRYRTISFAPGLLRLTGRLSNQRPFEWSLNH